MTTIKVQTEEWEEHPFTIEATITIDDSADGTGFLQACRIAMLMEGYSNEVIRNACQKVEYELEEAIDACFKVMSSRKEE